MMAENTDKMPEIEYSKEEFVATRLAFLHATKLIKDYREEIDTLNRHNKVQAVIIGGLVFVIVLGLIAVVAYFGATRGV